MTDSLFSLRGRVALVTGGASGIGAGIARVLAGAGAHVAIADRNAEGASAMADELASQGHTASAHAVDLTDEAAVVALVADVVRTAGVPWALVNNAGVQHREMLLEGTVAHWEMMNQINARAPFLLTREVAKAMISAGQGGRIVNCASSGLIGQAVGGLSAYLASKGALAALTRASAMELAEHAITVNTVLPGGVGTPGAIHAKGPPPVGPGNRRPPLGTCTGEDIASAVLYFATPAARFVTNQVLCVDAGWSVT